MEKLFVVLGFLSLSAIEGFNSVVVKKSGSEIYNHKEILAEDKSGLDFRETPKLELIIDVRNLSQSHILSKEKKKQRRERIRKRKDKNGKFSKQKNRSYKTTDYIDRQTLRNNEKVNLVRNKTIEILKNGLKILSASGNYSQTENKSMLRVNETLLEKILSSAVPKQHILLSASGSYKLPIGIGIYETRVSGGGHVPLTNLTEKKEEYSVKKESKKQDRSGGEIVREYDYDYDLLAGLKSNSTTDLDKSYTHVDYESINLDHNIGTLLEQIVNVLRNLTECTNGNCGDDTVEKYFDLEDPCQRWLNCRQTLDQAFSRGSDNLPSCPCTYPSSIFYDDTIWDKNHKKYFRWKDASSESERLDIYKPGAAYCIRSLVTQGSLSVSSQQCCYDRRLRLLTRGSGAGTVNFISPDVSKKLHYTVDILPWRLCKGDFTRYNLARKPDNGNDCIVNPDEQQYQLQMKLSKIF